MTYPALTPEQRAALEAYANANGIDWRDKLGMAWMNCAEPEAHKAALRQVRNTYGPTWLHDAYAYGWLAECPEIGEGAKWSAPFDPPAIGDRVNVRINGLGHATVTGYFVEGGWLGVVVLLDAPKEWYLKQNGGNVPGHSFGAEIEKI